TVRPEPFCQTVRRGRIFCGSTATDCDARAPRGDSRSRGGLATTATRTTAASSGPRACPAPLGRRRVSSDSPPRSFGGPRHGGPSRSRDGPGNGRRSSSVAGLFPKWMNALPTFGAVAGLGGLGAVVLGGWYYLTPDFF